MSHIRHPSLERLDSGWTDPLPGDPADSMRLLNALSGSQGATVDMMTRRRWLGAEWLARSPGMRPARRNVQLASGTGFAGARIGTAMGSPGGPAGALAGAVTGFAAGVLLYPLAASGLAWIQSQLSEEDRLAAVMLRFQLSRAREEDVRAARAYLWASTTLPRMFFGTIQTTGPTNERAAEAVMRLEQRQQGITLRAAEGNREAQAELQATLQRDLAGMVAADALVFDRTSLVHSDLSAHSNRARRALAITTAAWSRWVAHHLIPFGVVASLPRNTQLAMVQAGWKMDAVENLLAMPGDRATYNSVVNLPFRPFHRGSHANYDRDVGVLLLPVFGPASLGNWVPGSQEQPLSREPVYTGVTGATLRGALRGVEMELRRRLFDAVNFIHYHERLN